MSMSMSSRDSIVCGTVGSALQRRVVLKATTRRTPAKQPQVRAKQPKTKAKAKETDDDRFDMSFVLAAECFRNALAMPPNKSNIPSPTTTHGDSVPASVNSVNSVEEPHPLQSSAMRQSALAHLAYSYLCLNEPVLALAAAKELMAMPNCTNTNRYLAHTYCSEAMLMRSKVHEALEYLSPTMTTSTTSTTTNSSSNSKLSDMSEAYCNDASVDAIAARVHAHVNLATVHIAQNNLSLAERYMSDVIQTDPTNAKAIELLVYIMLRKRQSSKALYMITTGMAVA